MMLCEKIDLVVWLTLSLFLPFFEFRLLARLLAKLVICVHVAVRHSSRPSKGGSSKIQVFQVLTEKNSVIHFRRERYAIRADELPKPTKCSWWTVRTA